MTIWQRVTTKPGYRVLAAIALIAAAMHYSHKEECTPIRKATYQDYFRTKQQCLAQYFRAKGSPVPEQMAMAVAHAKRPELAAAQAVVESNANPKARGKAGEKGAWQVIEKYHGPAGQTIRQQLLKNEQIIDDLLRDTNGDLNKSVRMYNGSPANPKTDTYLRKVMAEAFEVTQWMP